MKPEQVKDIHFFGIEEIGVIHDGDQGGTRKQSFGSPDRELPYMYAEGGHMESAVAEGRLATEADIKSNQDARIKYLADLAKPGVEDFLLYTKTDKEGAVTKVTATALEILEYGRKVWLDKKGDVKPTSRTSAILNRRLFAMLVSQFAYCKFHNDFTLKLRIPFKEVDISSSQKLFEVRERENNVNRGRSAYTEAESLIRACHAVNEFGYLQGDLEKIGFDKAGARQKFYSCAVVCKHHDKRLHLSDRALMPVPMVKVGKVLKAANTYTQGGFWDIKSWDAADGRVFLGTGGDRAKTDIERINAISERVCFAHSIEPTDENRLTLFKKCLGNVEMDSDIIERYIEATFVVGSGAGKMMSKSDIGNYSAQYAGTEVESMLKAIVGGDATQFVEASKKLAALQEEVTDLNLENTTLQEEVAELKVENATLQEEVAAFKVENATLKGRVQDLEHELSAKSHKKETAKK
jgi:regulator of replication initiation timing